MTDMSPMDAWGQEALGTDLCECGHIRDQHIGWPSAQDCLGGPDHSPCVCDSFSRVGGDE